METNLQNKDISTEIMRLEKQYWDAMAAHD
ncbi:MAG: hypothetical protein K0R29_1989, partial [Pseudobdellovibrio sp.]|nr:hypothetical protein [Pseudobdellovibrio sp.]